MFYTNILKSFNLSYTDYTYNDDIKKYNLFKRIVPHFFKKDMNTNQIRQLDINDNLEMLKPEINQYFTGTRQKWKYFNFKDVLFYYNRNGYTVFTRDNSKYTIINQGTTNFNRNILLFPHIHLITKNDNKKLFTHSKVINYKSSKLFDLYYLGLVSFNGNKLSFDYCNNVITPILKEFNLLEEGFELTKTDAWHIYTAHNHIVFLINNITNNLVMVVSYINKTTNVTKSYYIEINTELPDGITVFDETFDSYHIKDGYKHFSYPSINIYSEATEYSLKNLSQFENNKNIKVLNNNIINSYDLSQINQEYQKLYPNHKFDTSYTTYRIDDDIFKLGAIVLQGPVFESAPFDMYGGSNTCKIGNFSQFNNTSIFDVDKVVYSFIFMYKGRSFKFPYSFSAYTTDSNFNAYSYMFLLPKNINGNPNLGFAATRYSNYDRDRIFYSKDLSICLTPKNKDFKYLEQEANTEETNQYFNMCGLLQNNFVGKNIFDNFEELPEKYNTDDQKTIDYMKSYDYRDLQLYNAPESSFNTENPGLGLITGRRQQIIDNKNKHIPFLIDSRFDYFNEIFEDALIYIIDTRILQALGCDEDYWNSIMPSRSIWFEVNDLYLYNTDGTIKEFNPKYIEKDTTTELMKFIYDYKQFTSFKAKYFTNTIKCRYDTQIQVETDFKYLDDTKNIYFRYCNSIYENIPTLFQHYSNAIFCLDNIRLDTGVE